MNHTYAIHIKGKVQGVFYRKSAREKAIEIGLTGTVSNEDDDSVLILATGTESQLKTFIDWCWQGPSRAKVESVQHEQLPTREFAGFIISRNW